MSWSQVNDVGLKASLARCSGLTSLNLTGLAEVTDEGVAALLGLTRLRRLALCCTGIGDAALEVVNHTAYSSACHVRLCGACCCCCKRQQREQ